MPDITPKELELIKALVGHNEYGEQGCLDNHPWSWAVCGTKAKGAVLGSLITKGLARQDGKGKDASCYLTTEGKKAYLQHFGRDGVWTTDDAFKGDSVYQE
jgi:hypothetical protein